MAGAPLYDRIGGSYTSTRMPDPRIEAAIRAALADAESVVNVGAGTGSYEPRDIEVVAVEPSQSMIDQRPAGAAPAIKAQAEALPFADDSFDAAMTVLSDHHWDDRARGLREMRRVARRRTVAVTWDNAFVNEFWLMRDYLPGITALPGMRIDEVAAHLGAGMILPVPIPADCGDGFMLAFWARPEAYLDAKVRRGISLFWRLASTEIEHMLTTLRHDLQSGEWQRRNSSLAGLGELDLGLRLVIAEYGSEGAPRAAASAV